MVSYNILLIKNSEALNLVAAVAYLSDVPQDTLEASARPHGLIWPIEREETEIGGGRFGPVREDQKAQYRAPQQFGLLPFSTTTRWPLPTTRGSFARSAGRPPSYWQSRMLALDRCRSLCRPKLVAEAETPLTVAVESRARRRTSRSPRTASTALVAVRS